MPDEFEVELKFRVEQLGPIQEKLIIQGAILREHSVHRDRYFNHPSKDYRVTDEAFRIRSVGDENCLTYKGAILGTTAKTRHEIEIPFASGVGAADRMVEMVSLLEFRFVREVQKTRQRLELATMNRKFEIALDEVPGLGFFVEIELIAKDQDRAAAESDVWNLARSLGLAKPEMRSYLQMSLEADRT